MNEKQDTTSIPLAVEYETKKPTSDQRTPIIVLSVIGGLAVFFIIILCLVLVIYAFLINTNLKSANNVSEPSATPRLSSEPTPRLIGTRQYSFAPPMLIDTNKQYFATIKMAKDGVFVIQLYPDKAPNTVNNFIFLARQGFFDGLTFYRVLEGFVAQTGDPIETGTGDAGYVFVNEENNLAYNKAGVVGMANAGPATNSSQFFITFGPLDLSESDYTIFGQVISGMDVVNRLTRRDPQANPNFPGDVIETITITER